MKSYPGGVWPVMLTPYHENGEVDAEGLAALTEWYLSNGVSGLFAACQSSEISFLSPEERAKITRVTVDAAAGRVPVIASGHVSDDFRRQARELNAMADAGAAAAVLITNRLCGPDDSDAEWLSGLRRLLRELDRGIALGLYECPLPYKRLMTPDLLKACADTGRFYFMKDTCCDAAMIRQRLEAVRGSNLQLYNANSSTLLESMRDGAVGFSGVMANFHPKLYVWLTQNLFHPNAERVQDVLAVCSLIERQYYPVNAKFHLSFIEGLPITCVSRAKDAGGLLPVWRDEVLRMDRICRETYERYCVSST